MKGFIRLTLILVILVALWQWLQDQEYERSYNERLHQRDNAVHHDDMTLGMVSPGRDIEWYDNYEQ